VGDLTPSLYLHQRRERGIGAARIEDDLVAAARRLAAGTKPPVG
jgi:hypothetical protein